MATSPESGAVTKHSPRSVVDTVARLRTLLESKGMTVFAVIDQRAAARQVGLDLRATTLVLFGNPRGGTPVMDAAPLAALDLPLRVLVWDGGTRAARSATRTPRCWVPAMACRPRRWRRWRPSAG